MRLWVRLCEIGERIDMLIGGASVLGWLVTTRIDVGTGSAGAWLNALEAQMRVHAVNMRKALRIHQ